MNQFVANADSSQYRRVGIQISAKTRDFMLAAARRLRERGAEIVLYTRGPEESAYFNAYQGERVWDAVVDAACIPREIQAKPAKAEETYARARALEKRIGRTVAELSFGHRHLGRGYFLGGFNHPRAETYDSADLLQTTHVYLAQLEFWFREIEQRELTLILQGDHIVQAVAASLGVPTRFLIGARYHSRWFWAADQYQTNPLLDAAWADAEPQEDLTVAESYAAAKVKNAEFEFWNRAAAIPYYTIHAAASMLWWRLRGYQKGRSYNFVDYTLWPLRQFLGIREVQKRFTARLRDLQGQILVYFPLHKEPEESYLLRSPEYFSQHAAIAALSRALPAGVRLAIKENRYAVARRPRDFYAQIAALKNVVLLDMSEDGIECVRRADVVATITGTAGLEAAVMGKPVLLFSRHMPIRLMPHVHTVIDEGNLPDLVKTALAEAANASEQKHHGRRFLSALVASTFDLGGFHYTAPGKLALKPEWVEAAMQGLYASLVANTLPAAKPAAVD